MIERILLPTDGSALSELALAPAAEIARAQQAEVTLVRVIEGEQDSEEQLDHLLQRLESEGIRAQTQLIRGTPVLDLLEFERKTRPGLVVMASHGRTGLARFMRGSVADVLVREGTAPVFIVQAFGSPITRLGTALVPLDGSPAAETALPMVEGLAGKPLQYVRLLRAVATPDESNDAYGYLEQIRTQLAAETLHVQTMVEVGSPEEVIAQAAAAADFVILSTHGRGGPDRLRHGSVADHVVHHVPIPSLLVRVDTVNPADPGTTSAGATS